jgi:hypothetical protein
MNRKRVNTDKAFLVESARSFLLKTSLNKLSAVLLAVPTWKMKWHLKNVCKNYQFCGRCSQWPGIISAIRLDEHMKIVQSIHTTDQRIQIAFVDVIWGLAFFCNLFPQVNNSFLKIVETKHQFVKERINSNLVSLWFSNKYHAGLKLFIRKFPDVSGNNLINSL